MVFSLANNKPERKWMVVTAQYYAVICLDKLKKMTNLSWDSESPGQQLNPGPPNYKMIPSFSITVFITEIWLHYCNNQ